MQSIVITCPKYEKAENISGWCLYFATEMGVKFLGNPLALCNKTLRASQTTVSRLQQGLFITQVASTVLTSLLVQLWCNAGMHKHTLINTNSIVLLGSHTSVQGRLVNPQPHQAPSQFSD